MTEHAHAKAAVAREPSRRPGMDRHIKHGIRSSQDTSSNEFSPSSAPELLGMPGQSLDGDTLRFMQPRFGFDFSRVRVHTGSVAAESAHHFNAAAYTVGRHVVFGTAQFAPATTEGRRLLAHELTHIVQQRNTTDIRHDGEIEVGPKEDVFERDARQHAAGLEHSSIAAVSTHALQHPRLQRSILGSFFSDLFSLSPGPFKAIGRAFGSESYSTEELQTYLKSLATNKQIEDHYDSDNKARAVVKQWTQNKPGFDLTSPVKILLIQEMESGHVSGADEQGILSILRGSNDQDLHQIFGKGGVDPKALGSDFSGDAAKALHAFYEQHFEGGLKAIKGGQKELIEHIQGKYSKTNLDAVIDQRTRRIEAAIAAVVSHPPAAGVSAADNDTEFTKQRALAGRDAANVNADDLQAELQKLSLDDKNQAVQEIASYRVRNHMIFLDLKDNKGEPQDPGARDIWQKNAFAAWAAVRMFDVVTEAVDADIAIGAPDNQAEFEKLTHPLTDAQNKQANQAIKPFTQDVVADAASDVPVAKHEAAQFFPGVLPGEKDTYQQQVEARTPSLIDETYHNLVVGHGEKEHSNPALTHQLSEMELIAQASQKEVETVFGEFIPAVLAPKPRPHPKGHGNPLVADKFDASGKLIKPAGQIHDAWKSEQSQLKSDPSHQGESAKFWMFYLLQNDTSSKGVSSINYQHHASPEFKEDTPQNPEARTIATVARRFILRDAKRLAEIGRGWPAFNTGRGNISLQLFKDPDEKEDRKFLWGQFQTVIHEYLHTLANPKYDKYAESIGGEKTTEGNTLIEGVDSLLTETVWSKAKPRAPLPETREKVEPEAFHAGKPFDASLVPDISSQRYSTFPNAVKLVSVVGTRNLYAAYFYGDVKLIGGKLP